MARYVVLSFEDNDEAETFIGQDKSGTLLDRASVVGLYAQPTLFCDLPHTKAEWKEYESKNAKRAWTIGQKFGWIICVICHKPSGKHLSPAALAKVTIARARNLMPEKTTGGDHG